MPAATSPLDSLCPICGHRESTALQSERKPRPTSIPDIHQFVTPIDLARAVGRSRSYVYGEMSAGNIHFRLVCGSRRIPLKEALRWIEANTI